MSKQFKVSVTKSFNLLVDAENEEEAKKIAEDRIHTEPESCDPTTMYMELTYEDGRTL